MLSPQLLSVWRAPIQELQISRSIARSLHAYFVAVGQRVMQSTQRPEPSQPKGISKPPAATCDAGILELAKLAITDLLAKFRHEDAAHVFVGSQPSQTIMLLWFGLHSTNCWLISSFCGEKMVLLQR